MVNLPLDAPNYFPGGPIATNKQEPSSMLLIDYLFKRLHQLGVRAIHGVPGDYNLESLDYVTTNGITWVANANELNAGYAADGYARVNGMGVLMTTFGVGELSAANAIAGSFAERIPVVHIVGAPTRVSQENRLIMHHTLGNGDYHVFARMYDEITVAHANVNDVNTATAEIDRVLRECVVQSRPVYIQLPTDMPTKLVDCAGISEPLDIPVINNTQETEDLVVKKILKRVQAASRPLLLVDGYVDRGGLSPAINSLVEKANLATFVTSMGKSVIDETNPNFGGVYMGAGSIDSVKAYVEASDLVLRVGAINSDFNTGGFSMKLQPSNVIELHPNFVSIGYARYDVQLRGILAHLTASWDPSKLAPIVPLPDSNDRKRTIPKDLQFSFPSATITHEYIWAKLDEFLQPKDVLIAESGTSYVGALDTHLPSQAKFISQFLWGSIGYALPAAQGAALAVREAGATVKVCEEDKKQRVILFQGDGSFQLTAQSLSDMVKNRLNLIVFIINNDGYTVERWIHGWDAEYNNIGDWHYTALPEAMGACEGVATVHTVRTKAEFEALWKNEDFASPKGLQFVELYMPREDAPAALKVLARAIEKTNTKR